MEKWCSPAASTINTSLPSVCIAYTSARCSFSFPKKQRIRSWHILAYCNPDRNKGGSERICFCFCRNSKGRSPVYHQSCVCGSGEALNKSSSKKTSFLGKRLEYMGFFRKNNRRLPMMTLCGKCCVLRRRIS